ncbi:23S rRNA (pseudouridine(1915)-N(3))-methyltransferase RlmH [Luminiphilus sp.]|nr:23S rRNA (pseudouridine(1915)-N(3))-methyltransferase RlmH [Luminiphilus sp.]MDB2586299.1 23S rRNA (pseudouridine(1915)-N(3))-methyltransferase RlmH [Luminiphilus sp.]MDB2667254.1 23S rRNA (pseudouridine(1915)-N(3))-methyltransferase RlmH [Luminiphilus sp.]MDC0508070.1 23S rRNA (pseudouridine(1915)-N(3))-methyltransferase RlmH [Luminiphilus sp.]MDC0973545.1 23S rRNA (pseudouridine(1915)-N(3))-methyltransferase RlmH [Luminiphilus sp.]
MRVIAIGTRMPGWVTEGSDEYLKRMPRELSVEWVELPASKRTRDTAELRMLDEATAIERRLKPQDLIVALDIDGKTVSTENIADALSSWQAEGAKVAFIIGGPDGLHPTLKARASARWSLGRITLPHPLVRVILAEQLYRACSINAGHPYHRA